MALAWGNPWRGLSQAGQITLPNSATKTTSQPAQVHTGHADEYGQTLLQRGPAAGVTRTQAELDADAASGRTWRTDAILSGARFHLYGKPLDGFVYCAPDGSRWLLRSGDLSMALDSSAPWTVTLTLARFGEFAGSFSEQAVTATLSDLGQAETDPESTAGTACHTQICDIMPDGSKALIMIYQPVRPFGPSPGFHPLHKRPLGWLELSLSGGAAGITASLSVARTRQQALGTGTWQGVSSTSVIRFEQDNALAIVDMGSYFEYTYTPQPLGATGSDGRSWVDNNGAYSYEFTDRILALWYTSSGALEEVTLSVSTTGTVSNPPPTETISGSQVQHVPKDGGQSTIVSDTRFHELGRTSTVSEAYSVLLKRGAVVIDQSEGTAEATLAVARNFIFGTDAYRTTTADAVTVEGVTYSSSGSSSGQGPQIMLGAATPRWFSSLLPGNSAPQAAFRATDMQIYTPDVWLFIDPLRYSNNLLALRRNWIVLETGAETWQHGPAALPGGFDPGAATVPFNALFGSYNPATGEASRDQTQPTCWI